MNMWLLLPLFVYAFSFVLNKLAIRLQTSVLIGFKSRKASSGIVRYYNPLVIFINRNIAWIVATTGLLINKRQLTTGMAKRKRTNASRVTTGGFSNRINMLF